MTTTPAAHPAKDLLIAIAMGQQMERRDGRTWWPVEADEALLMIADDDTNILRIAPGQPGYVTRPPYPQGLTANCWCHKCNESVTVDGFPLALTQMILCPDCGNKRCPKANNHANACTQSNAPGQPGSAYTAPPPPKRGPLSQQEIDELWADVYNGQGWSTWYATFVRAIEAAHGITPKEV